MRKMSAAVFQRKEIEELTCMTLRDLLMKWYAEQEADGVNNMTKLQDFNVGFIGDRHGRCLRLKAAESKYFFYFMVDVIHDLEAVLPRGDLWRSVAVALKDDVA